MSPTVTSCDSSSPLSGANGIPDVDPERQNREPVLKNKNDQWVGFFAKGGYLWGDIDTAKAVWPLTIWCFLTGFMSVTHFFLSKMKKTIANVNPNEI